jgi:hypothetical protein
VFIDFFVRSLAFDDFYLFLVQPIYHPRSVAEWDNSYIVPEWGDQTIYRLIRGLDLSILGALPRARLTISRPDLTGLPLRARVIVTLVKHNSFADRVSFRLRLSENLLGIQVSPLF